MKILILNGSPKNNGSTAKILKAIGQGISKTHHVQWVDVNDLNMKSCTGCMQCRPDKNCILPEDDAHRVGQLIAEADALIVGTPTYWGNITGQLKILFDRSVPIFEYIDGLKIKPVQQGKKALIVVTSAAPFPFNLLNSQSRGAVKSLKTILKSGGYRISRIFNISGTTNFDKRSDELLNKAKRIGENF